MTGAETTGAETAGAETAVPERDDPGQHVPEPGASGHDFPVHASTELYRGAVLALRSDAVGMPGGRTATREITEHPGAVAVAALDADDRLMMILQYRHAVRRRLWELPAGLLDVAGEDPLDTARRELLEESGVEADDWSLLVDVVPSPGFSDESVRVYLARGAREVARPESAADDEEADLTTAWTPLPTAVAMVLRGEVVNATSVAAILAAHTVAVAPGAARDVATPWVDRPTRFAARRATPS